MQIEDEHGQVQLIDVFCSQQSIAGGPNTDLGENHQALLYQCKLTCFIPVSGTNTVFNNNIHASIPFFFVIGKRVRQSSNQCSRHAFV